MNLPGTGFRRDDNSPGSGAQARNKPAENKSCCDCSGELRSHERKHVKRTNTGESVGK